MKIIKNDPELTTTFFECMPFRTKIAFFLFGLGKIFSIMSGALIASRSLALAGWCLALALMTVAGSVTFSLIEMFNTNYDDEEIEQI